MYHDRDKFDFSQGHVTKNQPMYEYCWEKIDFGYSWDLRLKRRRYQGLQC